MRPPISDMIEGRSPGLTLRHLAGSAGDCLSALAALQWGMPNRLGDFAREVGDIARPIPEAGPEAVDGGILDLHPA